MSELIVITLNDMQKAKIKKKLGKVCDTIEVDREQLENATKYMGPQICIDFDDEQEAIIKKAFPEKECDFAVFNGLAFPGGVRYMAPPGIKPE